MPYDTNQVGKAVARVRDRVGISNNAWAQKAGLSESTIRDICAGKTRSTRLETIYALAEAVDVPVWELLGEDVPWREEYERLRAVLRELYAQEERRTAAIRDALDDDDR